MTERVNSDHPPFSRVFVVCSKTHRDEDIRAAFERFGHVEDVWMVKDRMTKENKGICYVKYDKASSAAMAIEAMDGAAVGDEPKPIKVRETGVCVDRPSSGRQFQPHAQIALGDYDTYEGSIYTRTSLRLTPYVLCSKWSVLE